MTIEKADRPKRIVHVIWSPSPIAPLWRHADQSRKRKLTPVPEDVRFEFYRPATSEQGGVYAEA